MNIQSTQNVIAYILKITLNNSCNLLFNKFKTRLIL